MIKFATKDHKEHKRMTADINPPFVTFVLFCG